MSFQKVRDSLIYCLADNVIDYEEFVLLYNAYESKNAAYPYWEYEDFCLDSLSSEAEAFTIHSKSHFDKSLGCPERSTCWVSRPLYVDDFLTGADNVQEKIKGVPV